MLIILKFGCHELTLADEVICFQLTVSIDVPGEESYHFQPRLFGKVFKSQFWYDMSICLQIY